ncbi:MAG: hypothetical protein M1813_003926 [Trichoglossum hirsutum]|nr:MAG: hypothetical protein M1813_003926 [Trichoglossum hirsutum]
MSPNPKLRRIILTSSIAAITVTGTLYGAGLKTQREAQQARRQKSEATDEERLEVLLGLRRKLVEQRDGLVEKMRELEEKGRR